MGFKEFCLVSKGRFSMICDIKHSLLSFDRNLRNCAVGMGQKIPLTCPDKAYFENVDLFFFKSLLQISRSGQNVEKSFFLTDI